MYNKIIMGMAENFKNRISRIEIPRNINLTLLSAKEKFLNFNENNRSSATNK